MYAVDFEYDGQYLSDYGFIICDFNSTTGADVIDAGSKITFNKTARNSGKEYSLVSTQYDQCVSATFDICKNPDIFDYEDMAITNDEFRSIVRWLNRTEFLKFQIFYEDYRDRTSCYYDASFNVDKITIGKVLYGIRLTMESNKPFGYGAEQVLTYTFSNATQSYILTDISDEIGSMCPYVAITCDEDGDIELHNALEGCTTLIKNCSVGEVITLDGNSQIISTTYNSHNICNDFNYEFFRIGNTINTRDNLITVSKPCRIEIRYSPIIKDVP